MTFEDHKKISVIFPNEIFNQLATLSMREKRTVSQQVVIIVANYLKDHKKMLEVVNEGDFGVITEEKLRIYLKEKATTKNYKYEDIKDHTFEELFKFWMENFQESSTP